jgi:hypothetical protein
VIEAATDPESWARLADNLEHEYRSASRLPHSPAGEPKPAAGSIEEVQPQHPEKVDFAEALERYGRSCDEMRTLRVNPLKATPLDQWSGEMRRRGSAIDRIQQEYARYVLRIADENERHADQARTWWAWWEKTQLEPSKAGPEPLVSPDIELALRIAAKQRGAGSPTVGGAPTDGASGSNDQGQPAEQDDGVAATGDAPAGDGTERGDKAVDSPAEAGQPEFSRIERAITLLMRDRGDRKSVREYAKLVGVSHTTLLRNEDWQRAWRASEPVRGELPEGTKDAEGNLEAWKDERCENCRQELITGAITVDGEAVRVCEKCREKLGPRTNPRTT